MDEMTLTLNNPITEEQWDAITDVDFENTDRVWFHTKHGKDVEFVKRKKGKWLDTGSGQECDQCHEIQYGYDSFRHFCANCGASMSEGEEE